MKKQVMLLAVCLAALSCDTNSDLVLSSKTILGFWSKETVYLNGVNSIQYVDFLNGGNFLHLKKDKTFVRAYDGGRWHLFGQTLTLDREESSGLEDWTFKIIAYSDENLVLEIQLTESKYCCDFDSFTDDEVITIREVYTRVN